MESMEAPLSIEGLREPARPFVGIFIRAPVYLILHSHMNVTHQSTFETTQVVLSLDLGPISPPIQILARLPASFLPADPIIQFHDTSASTIVALRQGLRMLSTFHPELTPDTRFHEFFVTECVIPTLRRGV
jgi:5'-phosphate synthase pdxT subunit